MSPVHSKKTILVTGASGFVGQRLCRILLQNNYAIRAVVRTEEKAKQLVLDNSDFPGSLLCLIENDLMAAAERPHFFDGVESVVHLAARVHVMKESSKNPLEEYRRINVDITRFLATKAAENKIKRFIFLSSLKVNGESSQEKFTELSRVLPQDPYAVSKWEAEQALHEISEQNEIKMVILRAPLIYGKGVKANFEKLIRAVNQKMPLPLASIKNARSLIYLDNLCEAIKLCLHHPEAENQTFLVADKTPLSTPDLIRHISATLKKPAKLYPFPIFALRFLGRLSRRQEAISRLINSLVLDDTKIRTLLNWEPPFSLEDALTRDFKELSR